MRRDPSPATRRQLRCAMATMVLTSLAWPAAGQSLPLLHPANPVGESRSGLYFQPTVSAGPGWRIAVGLDYASMVELGLRYSSVDTSYLLDAETLRLNLSLSRDLGPRTFVLAEAWAGGSYGGFLDGFLNWYHGLFGINFPERELRPAGRFDYRYKFADNRLVRFEPHAVYLGDVRLGIGRRVLHGVQSVLSLTLPTHTGGAGYGRGVPSISLLNTARAQVAPRLVLEGSANIGWTPRHGLLSTVQEQLFVLGTAGLRWRTIGSVWSFGNLYLHSPYYSGTEAGQLDNWDLTVDFGWIVRSGSGREFRFGMTEDLRPGGPAIDTNFRLGVNW
ncbi:MAG: DUF3187 family protein [Gemmatimonadales bacterium]